MVQPAEALTRVIARIESMAALDGPAKKLTELLSKAVPEGPVKDAASGTWLGHPLHPMLVSLPIGAWTSATVLDLTTGKGSSKAARRLVGLGLLTALPTATAGGSDLMDTMGAERRVGLVHAAGAWLSMGLYAASWRARRPGRHGGTLYALAGAGALAVTGYLGGHLSYALGVGVDTTAFEAGPEEWTDVAADDEIAEGTSKQVRVDGVSILVARTGGKLYALADRCTHRGGPLSEGELEGGCVVCPWHGSTFRLADGELERGPATMAQPTYDIRVSDGQIVLRRMEERSLRRNPA